MITEQDFMIRNWGGGIRRTRWLRFQDVGAHTPTVKTTH